MIESTYVSENVVKNHESKNKINRILKKLLRGTHELQMEDVCSKF